VVRDIDERLIEKVAINTCINPLTAVHRVKNGALLSEAFKAQSSLVTSEVVAILEELGHTKLASGLHNTVRAVMTDTAENTSSMLSDVLAGRRTEADSILGWLLNQSTHDQPTLRALLSQLQSIEPDS
jgi:2-dehydropantoate 2-reductase